MNGIRTAKLTGNTLTGYLLDGGNVVAELEDDALSASYLRGANLISRTTSATEYYTFNAHGDVVNLTNASGISVKTYDYDAFGNEKDRVGADPNPFRYCGEYFDVESGSYYLRARYYDPSIGRFTQEDTHWNTSNMIYGDEPQQIGEYKDPLGTSRYVYAPKVSAIKQAANQYGYGLANPVYYCDRNGKMGEMALQWSAGMWWLTLIDGVLPVGDVIYVVGIGVLSIADAINTFGADNVVRLITDAPNVLSESIRSLSHWVQNIGKGGTVPNPGDPNWGKGFKSFRQLKKFLGSPGKGKEWHHIVEQCQEKSTRAGFSSQQIQNTNNVINISKEVHKQISAFYSRVPDTMLVDTGGMTFRDWLSTMSFAEQYEWGIWVLRYFGVEI